MPSVFQAKIKNNIGLLLDVAMQIKDGESNGETVNLVEYNLAVLDSYPQALRATQMKQRKPNVHTYTQEPLSTSSYSSSIYTILCYVQVCVHVCGYGILMTYCYSL